MRKADFVTLGLCKKLPFDNLFESMLIEEREITRKTRKTGQMKEYEKAT